jgi:hypothetical protein
MINFIAVLESPAPTSISFISGEMISVNICVYLRASAVYETILFLNAPKHR